MVSVRDVVGENMCSDPTYYVGRGNMLIDLNSSKLELIWEQVVCLGGREAGHNFVRMVTDLTKKGDVSATTFLTALSDLVHDGWKYSGSVPSSETAAMLAIEMGDHARGGDSDNTMKSALKYMVSAERLLGGSPNQVTAERISSEFLQNHPLPPKASTPQKGDIKYGGTPSDERIASALRRINTSVKPPGPSIS